jgi:hypothetical protein
VNSKLCLYLALASLTCLGGLNAQATTVALPEDSITFTLPADWIPISPDIVSQRAAEVAKTAPKAGKIDFKSAYQPSGGPWFSYPYMLIKIRDTGRIPESELQKLPSLDMSKINAFVRELAPRSAVSDISIGKMSYDPDAKRIWSESKASPPGGMDLRAIMMTVPTQKGAIDFYFYSPADQYQTLEALFLKTAASVMIGPDIAYKSDLESGVASAGGSNYTKYAVTAIALMLFLWIRGLFNKKRSTV